jgi:hypothetical protein
MGRSWAFFRPYRVPPFVTRLEDRDGVVGRHYFRDLAEEKGAELRDVTRGTGIIGSLDELKSRDFDPGKLSALVRMVWENTTSLEFSAVKLKWSPWMKPLAPLYRLIGRSMRQLTVPDEDLLPSVIKSRVSVMDVDRNGETDYRVWLRTVDRDVYYVGAVFTHKCDGSRGVESYLDVVLPLFRSNVAFVFQPSNLDHGGVCFRTGMPGSYDAGAYLIIPGPRRYWMAPFFGLQEEIRVVEKNHAGTPVLEATHLTSWLGFPSFTLTYVLRPARGGAGSIGRTRARSRRRPRKS